MKISKREKEILTLLCLSNKLIASELKISFKTVEYYVQNLFYKFNSENRTEVLIKALKNNVITLDEILIEE